MHDIILIFSGAGATLVGIVIGRIQRPKRTSNSKPMCGCGHALALHDVDSRKCHGTITRPHYWASGSRNGREHVDCNCRQYDGPQPLPEFFAPEIAS